MSLLRLIVVPWLKVIAKSRYKGFQSSFPDSKFIVDLSSEFPTAEPGMQNYFFLTRFFRFKSSSKPSRLDSTKVKNGFKDLKASLRLHKYPRSWHSILWLILITTVIYFVCTPHFISCSPAWDFVLSEYLAAKGLVYEIIGYDCEHTYLTCRFSQDLKAKLTKTNL